MKFSKSSANNFQKYLFYDIVSVEILIYITIKNNYIKLIITTIINTNICVNLKNQKMIILMIIK